MVKPMIGGLDNNSFKPNRENTGHSVVQPSTTMLGGSSIFGGMAAVPAPPRIEPVVEKKAKTAKAKNEAIVESKQDVTPEGEEVMKKKPKPARDPNAKTLRQYITEALVASSDGLSLDELYAICIKQIKSPKPGYRPMLDKMEDVVFDEHTSKYRIKS